MRKKQEKAYDLVYFISVLVIASILLAFFNSSDYDMSFEKRMTADFTVLSLKSAGVPASMYNAVIRIHGDESYINEANYALARYVHEVRDFKDYREIRALNPTREEEKIIRSYVSEQQSNGKPIFFMPAVVITENPVVIMEIVPECVGWLGFFAVSALIIAYPRTDKRKKMLGIFIALPLVFIINVFRLFSTFLAGYYYGAEALYFTHDVLWKTILLSFSLLLWLFWIHFIAEEKSFYDLKKSAGKLFKRRRRSKK